MESIGQDYGNMSIATHKVPTDRGIWVITVEQIVESLLGYFKLLRMYVCGTIADGTLNPDSQNDGRSGKYQTGSFISNVGQEALRLGKARGKEMEIRS